MITLQPHHPQRDAAEGMTAIRSTGRIWLVTAFVAGAVYVSALLMMRSEQAGISTAGIVAVAATYVAMLVARFTVHSIPVRLGTLAAGFLLMSLVALVCLVLLALIAPIT
jgi:hypothetical protein